MERNRVSGMLRKIRRIQLMSTFAQCSLILGTALLGLQAILLLSDHYSRPVPAAVWITGSAIVLALLAHSLIRYSARDDRINAHQLDEMYGLKERVTTYVELRKSAHPFLNPLVHECEAKLDIVSPWKASCFLKEMLLPAILVLITGISIAFIPMLPVSAATLLRKAEKTQITEMAKDLERKVQQLQRQPSTPQMKKLLEEFKNAAKELQKPDADRAKALRRLNALEDEIKKNSAQNQQRLSRGLQNAWDDAQKGNAEDNLSDAQKAELQNLAKSFDQAMHGQEPLDGNRLENLNTENFSTKDIQSLKDAIKKFEAQKAQSDQLKSQLEEALESARKGPSETGHRNRYTTDSRLKDRAVERNKGGVDDGPGTTNQDSGPSHFDTHKKNPEEYVEDRTKAKYEQIYSGERENAGKDPLYLQNHWSENGDPAYTNVRNFGVNRDPQSDGLADGLVKQSQKESAVRKERVPPSYQEIVKKYFEQN
jgi:hypothetical protein